MGAFNDMGGSPDWFFKIIKGPAFHATFFFLLGGFIFTTKFFPELDHFKLKPFLFKRFKELYPLHLVTTLLMAALYIVRSIPAGSVNIPRLGLSVFLHLTFLWPFFPFQTEALNRPSWALADFFLCYLLFGIMLKLVKKLHTRQQILIFTAILFLPSILWGWLFAASGGQDSLYQFFHSFPLLHLAEFFMGMLLARFFMLIKENNSSNKLITGFLSDMCMLILFFLIYKTLGIQQAISWTSSFIIYHSVLPLLFLCIVFLVASENGIISRLFSMKFVRDMGRCSFYPYLLHIPYFAWITFIAEVYFNNNKLLHKPLNVWIFIIILYIGSYFYGNKFKKKPKVAKNESTESGQMVIYGEDIKKLTNAEPVG
jgi:peptidoglycan/LPS O-acetylase OafA/YrhL